jgi:hypothetical protein
VIVAVGEGEYEPERARGEPGFCCRREAGREERDPPERGREEADFSSKYSSAFFFRPLRVKEGRQRGGGGGGGGGGGDMVGKGGMERREEKGVKYGDSKNTRGGEVMRALSKNFSRGQRDQSPANAERA